MENPLDRSDQISRLVERRERDPRTHTFAELAELYRQAGELDRALDVIEDGLRHHPHFLNARLVYARLLRELGRAEEATRTFESVLEIDSENETARRALTELGRGPADMTPVRASGPAPSEPRSAQWLARLDAEWRGDSPVERKPPPPRAEPERGGDLDTATLAQLYVSQGFIEQAVGIYERLLARDPYNARLAAALEDARSRGKGGKGGKDQAPIRTSARPAAPPPAPPPARPPHPEPVPEPPESPELPDPPVREFLQALLEGRAPVEEGEGNPIDWPEWLRNLGSRG
ncbi:MAG: tetratricopeptide repeat protein [Gemmatimonadota bacterium]